MQLTKRKVYGGILGLCVGGFLLDKTVLGPADAAAESTAFNAVATTASDAPVVAAASASTGLQVQRIALAIDRSTAELGLDVEAVSDAFVPHESWFPEPDSPISTPEAPAGPGPAERFVAAHQLQAVMAGGQSGIAVIDGRSLRVGEVLDGFTLVTVADRAAVLEGPDGATARLELEDER